MARSNSVTTKSTPRLSGSAGSSDGKLMGGSVTKPIVKSPHGGTNSLVASQLGGSPLTRTLQLRRPASPVPVKDKQNQGGNDEAKYAPGIPVPHSAPNLALAAASANSNKTNPANTSQNKEVQAQFLRFAGEFASSQDSLDLVRKVIEKKVGVGPAADAIMKFYAENNRNGILHTLEHLAVEPAIFAAIIAKSFLKNAKESASKHKKIKPVIAQFSGVFSEPIQALDDALEGIGDEEKLFDAEFVAQVRTTDIICQDLTHRPSAAAEAFANIRGEVKKIPRESLAGADVVLYQCYGKAPKKDEKIPASSVANSIPPSGEVLTSMIKYYENNGAASFKIFCGEHHDVTQPESKAKEEAKKSLAKFYSENDCKDRVFTDKDVLGSPEFSLVAARMLRNFERFSDKKEKYKNAVIKSAAQHLIAQYQSANNFKDINQLKAALNPKPPKRPAAVALSADKEQPTAITTEKAPASGKQQPLAVPTARASISDKQQSTIRAADSKHVASPAPSTSSGSGSDSVSSPDVSDSDDEKEFVRLTLKNAKRAKKVQAQAEAEARAKAQADGKKQSEVVLTYDEALRAVILTAQQTGGLSSSPPRPSSGSSGFRTADPKKRYPRDGLFAASAAHSDETNHGRKMGKQMHITAEVAAHDTPEESSPPTLSPRATH